MGFGISPQVLRKKLLASLSCRYLLRCVSFTYMPLKDTTFVLDNWHPMRNFHKWFLLAALAATGTACLIPVAKCAPPCAWVVWLARQIPGTGGGINKCPSSQWLLPLPLGCPNKADIWLTGSQPNGNSYVAPFLENYHASLRYDFKLRVFR